MGWGGLGDWPCHRLQPGYGGNSLYKRAVLALTLTLFSLSDFLMQDSSLAKYSENARYAFNGYQH